MNDEERLSRTVWTWIYGDKDGNRTDIEDLITELEQQGFPCPDGIPVE